MEAREGPERGAGHTPVEEGLAVDAAAFEGEVRTLHPCFWWGTLLGPFVVTGLVVLSLGIGLGVEWTQRLLVTAVATFFFFGKFVILGGGEAGDVGGFFSAEELFALVVYMDLAVATIVVCHVGTLFRLPGLGRRLAGVVSDGRFILATRPWIRRATFIGTVAFVMFPLAATGSIGGAVFGRLLGMSRWSAFFAILIGSVLGNTVMYFGAGFLQLYLDRDDPLVQVGGIGVIVGIILLLNHRYRRLKSQHGVRGDSGAR